MVLLRTIAICRGASSNTILDYNLVRFGVCIIKLCHERMLILRCRVYPSPKKTKLSPEKKFPPRPSPPLPKNSITSLLKLLTLLENVLTLPENFTCNHPENLSKPLNNSQPSGIFLNPPENFTHTLKMSQPPQYFLTPPPRKKSQLLPDIISTLLKKSQPLPKKSQPLPKNRNPYRKKMSTRPPE